MDQPSPSAMAGAQSSPGHQPPPAAMAVQQTSPPSVGVFQLDYASLDTNSLAITPNDNDGPTSTARISLNLTIRRRRKNDGSKDSQDATRSKETQSAEMIAYHRRRFEEALRVHHSHPGVVELLIDPALLTDAASTQLVKKPAPVASTPTSQSVDASAKLQSLLGTVSFRQMMEKLEALRKGRMVAYTTCSDGGSAASLGSKKLPRQVKRKQAREKRTKSKQRKTQGRRYDRHQTTQQHVPAIYQLVNGFGPFGEQMYGQGHTPAYYQDYKAAGFEYPEPAQLYSDMLGATWPDELEFTVSIEDLATDWTETTPVAQQSLGASTMDQQDYEDTFAPVYLGVDNGGMHAFDSPSALHYSSGTGFEGQWGNANYDSGYPGDPSMGGTGMQGHPALTPTTYAAATDSSMDIDSMNPSNGNYLSGNPGDPSMGANMSVQGYSTSTPSYYGAATDTCMNMHPTTYANMSPTVESNVGHNHPQYPADLTMGGMQGSFASDNTTYVTATDTSMNIDHTVPSSLNTNMDWNVQTYPRQTRNSHHGQPMNQTLVPHLNTPAGQAMHPTASMFMPPAVTRGGQAYPPPAVNAYHAHTANTFPLQPTYAVSMQPTNTYTLQPTNTFPPRPTTALSAPSMDVVMSGTGIDAFPRTAARKQRNKRSFDNDTDSAAKARAPRRQKKVQFDNK